MPAKACGHRGQAKKNLILSRTASYRARAEEEKLHIKQLIEKQAVRDRHRLEIFISRLEAESPLKRMGGGYGFVTDGKDRRIDSVKQVKAGDKIGLRLRDGSMEAVVSRVAPAESGLFGSQREEVRGDR